MFFRKKTQPNDKIGKIPFNMLPEPVQQHAEKTRKLNEANWNKLAADEQKTLMNSFAVEMTQDYKKDQAAISLSLTSNQAEEKETIISSKKEALSYLETTRYYHNNRIHSERRREEKAMFGEDYSDADVSPRADLLKRLQAAGFQSEDNEEHLNWLTLKQTLLINEICDLVENKADDDEIQLLLRKAVSSAYFDVTRDLAPPNVIPNYGQLIIQLLVHQNQTPWVIYFVEEYKKVITELAHQKQKELKKDDSDSDDEYYFLPKILQADNPEYEVYSNTAKYAGAMGNIALTDYFLSQGASIHAAANAAIKHHHKNLIQHLLQKGLPVADAIRAGVKFTFQRLIYGHQEAELIQEREHSLATLRFLLEQPHANIRVATKEIIDCITFFDRYNSHDSHNHASEIFFILKTVKAITSDDTYVEKILTRATKASSFMRRNEQSWRFGKEHDLNLEQIGILYKLVLYRDNEDCRYSTENIDIIKAYPDKAEYMLQLYYSILYHLQDQKQHGGKAEHVNEIKSLIIEACNKQDNATCHKLVKNIVPHHMQFATTWQDRENIKTMLDNPARINSKLFRLLSNFVGSEDPAKVKNDILTRSLKDTDRLYEFVSQIQERMDGLRRLAGYTFYVEPNDGSKRIRFFENAIKYAEESILEEQKGLVESQQFSINEGPIHIMLDYIGMTDEQEKQKNARRKLLFSNAKSSTTQSTDFEPIAALEKLSSILQGIEISNTITDKTNKIIPSLREELKNLDTQFHNTTSQLASDLDVIILKSMHQIAIQKEQKSDSENEQADTTKKLDSFMSELKNLHHACATSKPAQMGRRHSR
jgi:hypothetical protein